MAVYLIAYNALCLVGWTAVFASTVLLSANFYAAENLPSFALISVPRSDLPTFLNFLWTSVSPILLFIQLRQIAKQTWYLTQLLIWNLCKEIVDITFFGFSSFNLRTAFVNLCAVRSTPTDRSTPTFKRNAGIPYSV